MCLLSAQPSAEARTPRQIKSKTEKESDLNDTKKDLAGTQKELDAALVTRGVRASLSVAHA